jgi:hypothetical protein
MVCRTTSRRASFAPFYGLSYMAIYNRWSLVATEQAKGYKLASVNFYELKYQKSNLTIKIQDYCLEIVSVTGDTILHLSLFDYFANNI